MVPKTFCAIASAVFALFALAHFARAVLDVTLTVDGTVLPIWVSWLAFALSATLSVIGFQAARRPA
jgi:hypothetical protein